MRAPVMFSLGLAVLAATPAVSHERVLVRPGNGAPPVWCPPLPSVPSGEQRPTGDPPLPGTFPGPAQNERMTNFELGSYDLGRDLPQLPGRTLRARFWLMEPGGVIGEHCHDDRPAYVYLLQGEVEETTWTPNGPVRRTIRAGEAVAERNGTRHWWVNQGRDNVLMVAVDVPRTQRPPPTNPAPAGGVSFQELSGMLLRDQYPHIPAIENYMMRGRLMTIQRGGNSEVEYHGARPGIAYVISGYLLEHRGDQPGALVRRPGDIAMLNSGLWNSWQNVSQGPATVLIVEFTDCGRCTGAE